MEIRAPLLVVIGALLIAGCGIHESQLVGHWKLRVGTTKPDEQALANGIASSISFDLRSDHTFSGTLLIFPIEGTWSLQGKQVVGQISKVLGQAPKDQQGNDKIVLDVSDDGKTLTKEPDPGSTGQNTVFVKDEAQGS